MGKSGPLKLPAHLQVVPDNSPATAASVVAPVAPAKPEAVSSHPELSVLWDQIVPELDRAGLVSVSDSAAIEMCLRHFLVARSASDDLSADIVVDDKAHSGIKKNPAEAVFRSNSEMFLKYASQLGMTFVSRARTPAPKGAGDGGSNPFAPPVG